MSWSDFIATQDLADSAQAPYLSHCDHLAVIRADGEEAGHYLQGQVSCDLREVDQQGHRTGMHLTLKGRGLVSVRIVRDGDDYLLLCPAGLSEAVIKALMKYRLRAKVEFTVDPNLVVLGLAGHLPASAPDHGNSAETDQGLWLRYPFTDHALLLVKQDNAEQVWQTLAADRATTGANGWQLADIDAGEGMVYPGAQDLFLPQVLNYDVTAGVNFKKGCYTGQEVVARMHFKGKAPLLKGMLIFQMFPAVLSLVALYALFDRLGQFVGWLGINTHGALIVASLGAVALHIWTIKGYFESIDGSLEEAAMVDGASTWQAFRYILLPLSIPILMVVFILAFVMSIMEYPMASVLLVDEHKLTLAVGAQQYLADHNQRWGNFAAAAVLSGLPITVAFLICQRWIIGGLTAGGVKG